MDTTAGGSTKLAQPHSHSTTRSRSAPEDLRAKYRSSYLNRSNNNNNNNYSSNKSICSTGSGGGLRGSHRISKRLSRRFSIENDTETNFSVYIDVDGAEDSVCGNNSGMGINMNISGISDQLYFGGPYAHIRQTLDYSYHTAYTKERQWLQDSIIDKLLNEIVVPNNAGADMNINDHNHNKEGENGNKKKKKNKKKIKNILGKKRPSDTSLDKLSWMPDEPWLVYVVGTCHAPNSTALQLLLEGDKDKNCRFPILSFVLVDPMEIQSLLPEYESYAKAQAQTQSQSRSQSHDHVELTSMRKETGYIAEILTRAALHLGTNVVVNTTFWNAYWYPRYFKLLRDEFQQRKLRIAILHLLAYDEGALCTDATYKNLIGIGGDVNRNSNNNNDNGGNHESACIDNVDTGCASTPLLSTIREGSFAVLKSLRSHSTSTSTFATVDTTCGSTTTSSSGSYTDTSNNHSIILNDNNLAQNDKNENRRIFNAVKMLIPLVEYNCTLKVAEQNDNVNIVTEGVTWKSFYTQFQQKSAVADSLVLENYDTLLSIGPSGQGAEKRHRCHRGDSGFIQTFDVNKSTEENYKSDNMEFYGPYAHLRKTLDYTYHKNYRKDRQMLQDAIITDTLDAARVIDCSGQVCTTPTEPFLVFTAGAMGAGKSHTLNFLNERGNFPLAAFVLIDPDEVRQTLPEFSLYVSKDALNAGSMTRKEAGYVVEILTLAALQSGKNVLVDTSLRDHEWYKEYFSRIRKDYPNVKLAILHIVAPEKAVFERAELRGKLTGRVVPKETLEMALKQVPKSVEILSKYLH